MDTKKDDRYPVHRGRKSRPLGERLFDNKGFLRETSSTPRGLMLSQSRVNSSRSSRPAPETYSLYAEVHK